MEKARRKPWMLAGGMGGRASGHWGSGASLLFSSGCRVMDFGMVEDEGGVRVVMYMGRASVALWVTAYVESAGFMVREMPCQWLAYSAPQLIGERRRTQSQDRPGRCSVLFREGLTGDRRDSTVFELSFCHALGSAWPSANGAEARMGPFLYHFIVLLSPLA
jgi:hypothetical protein